MEQKVNDLAEQANDLVEQITSNAMVDIAKYPNDMAYIRSTVREAVSEGMLAAIDASLDILKEEQA